MKRPTFFSEKLSISKLSIVFLYFSFFISNAQVTTNSGSGLAPTYPDLAAAITALNSATITSPVVITLAGNETAPVGGYRITAEGTATNTIIVQGVTSTITASAALTVGALNDAIFKLVGADYVTLRNFVMQENATNTIGTTAISNNMTEWGVALLYLTATNGAQNNTIQGNTISLNRMYTNTFGIYSSSVHTEAAPTALAVATGLAGNNTGLSILANAISNVNFGIAVTGPNAVAADFNQTLTIGAVGLGNTIANFGTGDRLSNYIDVPNVGFGILVKYTNDYDISYNTVASSNGGYIGTSTPNLYGIYIALSFITPLGTQTQNINNNSISLRPGAPAFIHGIDVQGSTASQTSSLSVSNNDFNNTTHTVAAASLVTFIFTNVLNFSTVINNNTFSNLSVNTSGNVSFIQNTGARSAGGARTANDNRIVGTFAKTTSGGFLTCVNFTDTGSTSGTTTINNNNFSNITLTGTSLFMGINSQDGTGTSVDKFFTNNTFNNVIVGSSPSAMLTISKGGSITQVVNNTFTNITSAGNTTGIDLLTQNGAVNINQNTISGITSTGATVSGVKIASGAVFMTRNKIVNLETNHLAGVVNGVTISAGLVLGTHVIANNIIGDLRAPITSAATDAVRGINITSGSATTNAIYNNSIYLAATSSGANFSTSGVFHTYGSPGISDLDLRNNIIVNNSTANGTGNVVALRRSAATDLNNFALTSNNNDLFAPNIYADGTNLDATLAAYQTRVATRETASISVAPNFLSTTSSNAIYLHIDPTIFTLIESGATPIAAIVLDFDGDVRNALTPDIGADEFTGVLSVNQFDLANGMKVYPNPVKNILNIEYPNELTNVTVFNLLGQQVLTKKVTATSTEVDMSSIKAGAYLVKVEANNAFGTIKVVKQ